MAAPIAGVQRNELFLELFSKGLRRAQIREQMDLTSSQFDNMKRRLINRGRAA